MAIAVLWKAIFKDDGLLNTLLGFFGVNGPSWLSDPSYALFVICLRYQCCRISRPALCNDIRPVELLKSLTDLCDQIVMSDIWC